MKRQFIVMCLLVGASTTMVTGCKNERDDICSMTWEEYGLGPADRVYAGQKNYYLADLDGDGWIIKPEFDFFCNVTKNKTEQQLLGMKALRESMIVDSQIPN